ncbi:hypothetical protein CL1_2017 [Thermococcus cleftensis]|uniref:Uncharacterized protein n=1 Tax=Thermococcus cleftensis (strain DSM 27260 / KACC 17922 / CL1) TaxID=163003 RepID=I3ZWX7_THECF|nr:hypothetical protein CL1_2017 [Thermococcus cleftensis]
MFSYVGFGLSFHVLEWSGSLMLRFAELFWERLRSIELEGKKVSSQVYGGKGPKSSRFSPRLERLRDRQMPKL